MAMAEECRPPAEMSRTEARTRVTEAWPVIEASQVAAAEMSAAHSAEVVAAEMSPAHSAEVTTSSSSEMAAATTKVTATTAATMLSKSDRRDRQHEGGHTREYELPHPLLQNRRPLQEHRTDQKSSASGWGVTVAVFWQNLTPGNVTTRHGANREAPGCIAVGSTAADSLRATEKDRCPA
jgi:hypothetical protein